MTISSAVRESNSPCPGRTLSTAMSVSSSRKASAAAFSEKAFGFRRSTPPVQPVVSLSERSTVATPQDERRKARREIPSLCAARAARFRASRFARVTSPA